MGIYDKVIAFMLENESIDYNKLYVLNDMVKDYFAGKIDNSGFLESEKKLLASIDKVNNAGGMISTVNQDDDFEHIFVNKNSESPIKARLYLSPSRSNLLPLVVEIINRSLKEKQRTHIKYSRYPFRLDQLIFYLSGSNDINEKIKLLSAIENDNPNLFQDMSQAPNWIYKTGVTGVYLAPEAVLKDNLCRKTSYGGLFTNALKETKYILEYLYGVKENDKLSRFQKDILFTHRFKVVFEELLIRYGIFLARDKNGNLVNVVSKGNIFEGPISSFEYDKENGILTESRVIDGNTIKEWKFGQSIREKTAFMDYISRNRQYSGEEH